jgi:hypothetical protein
VKALTKRLEPGVLMASEVCLSELEARTALRLERSSSMTKVAGINAAYLAYLFHEGKRILHVEGLRVARPEDEVMEDGVATKQRSDPGGL